METEFLYGPNTAEELLSAGRRRVLRLVVSRGAGGKAAAVADLARRRGVRVEFADPEVLPGDRAAGRRRVRGEVEVATGVGAADEVARAWWGEVQLAAARRFRPAPRRFRDGGRRGRRGRRATRELGK